jgi:protein gp37
MSSRTGIEWTDATWNPFRGCSPVSPGCANCYASRTARRGALSGPGRPYEGLITSSGKWTGDVRFAEDKLDEPIHWKDPRRVFVGSMSDPLHAGFSDREIAAVFATMRATTRHTYQLVTKRPLRYVELGDFGDFEDLVEHESEELAGRNGWCHADGDLSWPLPNLHLLVSCEDQRRYEERVRVLLECRAAVRGLSLEPLLDHIDLGPELSELDWVIVGCEKGPGRRPCDVRWILDIVRQCRRRGVPVFVKQVEVVRTRRTASTFKVEYGTRVSSDPDECGGWSAELRVRMMPGAGWL